MRNTCISLGLEILDNLGIDIHLFGFYPIATKGNQNNSSGFCVCFKCKKLKQNQVRISSEYVSRLIHV